MLVYDNNNLCIIVKQYDCVNWSRISDKVNYIRRRAL